MKQIITEKQFNEIKDEQKAMWYQFCREHKYVIYDNGGDDFQIKDFPSIGEMIGFLANQVNLHNSKVFNDEIDSELRDLTIHQDADSCWVIEGFSNKGEQDDLCDALWEEVKEVLKN